jgi:hypothetical protein
MVGLGYTNPELVGRTDHPPSEVIVAVHAFLGVEGYFQGEEISRESPAVLLKLS